MVRRRGKFLICVNCRRVYAKNELEEERKERGRDRIVCPFCGSVNFSNEFENIVLIIEPTKSKVAEFLKIVHPGVYGFKF